MPGAFAKLLGKLVEGGVRHVVVGGVAVNLHGFIRVTRDLDIIVEATPENARRLLDVLGRWGEGHARELSVEDFVPAELGCIRIGEDCVLDVFTLMRARGREEPLDYAALRADAAECVTDEGLRVTFLSAERLIELKTDTGRPKDQNDVDVLREILIGARAVKPGRLEEIEPALGEPPAGEDGGEWPAP